MRVQRGYLVNLYEIDEYDPREKIIRLKNRERRHWRNGDKEIPVGGTLYKKALDHYFKLT